MKTDLPDEEIIVLEDVEEVPKKYQKLFLVKIDLPDEEILVLEDVEEFPALNSYGLH